MNQLSLIDNVEHLCNTLASFIDLTHTGPLSKTVMDFWRMIWQEKVCTVAMVTNLKENKKIKCQQYWPESGSKSYGPFMVTITDQQVFADYTIRLLQLQVSTASMYVLYCTPRCLQYQSASIATMVY